MYIHSSVALTYAMYSFGPRFQEILSSVLLLLIFIETKISLPFRFMFVSSQFTLSTFWGATSFFVGCALN